MKNVMMMVLVLMSLNSNASTGLANPASVNCIELGGSLEITKSHGGQTTNCAIPQVALYRAMAERGRLNFRTNEDGSLSGLKPAVANCIDSGGLPRTVTTNEQQLNLCVIEEWQLFHVVNTIYHPVQPK